MEADGLIGRDAHRVRNPRDGVGPPDHRRRAVFGEDLALADRCGC